MVNRTQPVRRNHDEKFGILGRIVSCRKSIVRARNFRETRQAADGSCFFLIGEPADEGRFVFLHAHGLRQGTIRNNGNAVHAGTGKRANFELELQGHFVVGMKIWSGFNLHAEIDVLGGGVGLLHGTRVPQGGKEIGGAEDDRDVAGRTGNIIGDSDIGETTTHEVRRDDGRWKSAVGSGGRLECQREYAGRNSQEHTKRVGIGAGDSDIGVAVLIEVRDGD